MSADTDLDRVIRKHVEQVIDQYTEALNAHRPSRSFERVGESAPPTCPSI